MARTVLAWLVKMLVTLVSLLVAIPALGQAADRDQGWQRLETMFVSGVPLVRLSVSGAAPEWFWLTFGLDGTVLDKAYAESLGLSASSAEPQSKEAMPTPEGRVDATIKAGEVSLEARPIATMSMKGDPARGLGVEPKGLISGQLLAGHAVRVDFASKSVSIRSSSEYKSTGHVVPILFWKDEVLVPIVVEAYDGQHVGAFGRLRPDYPGALYVHPDWVRDVFLGHPGVQERDTARGLVRVFHLGDLELSDLPTTKDPHASGISRSFDATLGRALLERFTITFDVERLRLVVEPGPDWIRTFRTEPVPARPDRKAQGPPWSVLESRFVCNAVLVKASVGESEPLWFALDTGSTSFALDESAAARLGVTEYHGKPATDARPSNPDTPAFSIDGLSPEGRSTDPTSKQSPAEAGIGKSQPLGSLIGSPAPKWIAVGPYGFTPDEVGVLSLRELLDNKVGRDVVGILGGDFFQRFAVRIDYANHTVQFCPAKAFVYDGPGTTLPTVYNRARVPLLVVSATALDGEVASTLVELDTGSGDSIASTTKMAIRFDSRFPSRPKYASGMTIYGPTMSADLTFTSLYLGPYEFKRVRAEACDIPFETDGNMPGILGTGILRRFTVIMDLSRQRVILEPNNRMDEPFHHPRPLGFWPVVAPPDPTDPAVTEGLRVKILDPGSPAEQAGVRIGDIVIEIDGVSVANTPLTVLLDRGDHGARSVALRIRRGDQVIDIVVALPDADADP